MNISNFNFEKNIFKTNNTYQLEIIFTQLFHDIEYKIYGEKECITYGKVYFNDTKIKKMIILNIDVLENIFISIKKDNHEYFEHVNLQKIYEELNVEENNKKNIKIDIKRKIKERNDINQFIKLLRVTDKDKKSLDEDSDDEEKDSDDEEKDSDDEEKDSDEEEDESDSEHEDILDIEKDKYLDYNM